MRYAKNLILFLIIGLFSLGELEAQKLTIEGQHFFMDQSPFDMWGIRVASATQSDSLTNHLLSVLDDYKSYHVNTIDIYLQGSSGGFSDPFSSDGKSLDQAHLARLKKIIESCADKSMAVVVGVFYQRVMADIDDTRNLIDSLAVVNAVKTVAKELKPYQNLIINIANEQNSSFYQRCDFYNFNDPVNMIKLCEVVKEEDPNRLVGAGGYHDSSNVVIGKAEVVDALLFDTFHGDIENGHHSGWHYDYFREMGVTGKPLVNVEMFGGWTRKFQPPGVYDKKGKKIHIKEIKEAAKQDGLYVHFHSNTWCQGPADNYPVRYDLAGMGTPDDPGIRWWFKEVKKRAD